MYKDKLKIINGIQNLKKFTGNVFTAETILSAKFVDKKYIKKDTSTQETIR